MTSTDARTTARPSLRLRVLPPRDPRARLMDFNEVYEPADAKAAQDEGGRCMNCGAAFCMPDSGYGQGCPIYNKIPEWNELARLGRWEDAYRRLSETNPFPEFTSRVCPAPCQDACILGINEEPVQIKGIERAITDRAFDEGWVQPQAPLQRTGKRVAVVGSGPAGLAAAERLNALGHDVTVYERSDRPGGLLRYGVPSMKLDKQVLDRRIRLMAKSGVRFELGCAIGRDLSPDDIKQAADAVVLACGALKPRELDLPGRPLDGIHQAVPYLTASMRAIQHGTRPAIDASGKHVVIIGAGDTGADCIATALRQGAASVVNLARGTKPPDERDAGHPWPGPRGTRAFDYAHEEAFAAQQQEVRTWDAETTAFIENRAKPCSAGAVVYKDGSGVRHQIRGDLIILAIGFTGSDSGALVQQFEAGARRPGAPETPVVTAGDMVMGPSLVVHAIAEGLRAAEQIALALAR